MRTFTDSFYSFEQYTDFLFSLLDCLEIIGWQIDVLDIRNVDLPYNIKTFSEQPIVMKVCQKDLTERSTFFTHNNLLNS